MVSKTTCTNKAGALAYFKNHLATADYFIAPGDPKQGVWVGNLAASLGLDGKPVSHADFEAWLSGDLRNVGSAASPDMDQSKLKRVRSSELLYTEFTYTAPKSLSVAAALDERLKSHIMEASELNLGRNSAATGNEPRRAKFMNPGAHTNPLA